MPRPAREPKRLKRDSELSKRRLIEAGIEVFAHHGFKATTTRMIAQRAGLNAALIARYFGGKHELLMAVVDAHSEGLVRPAERSDLDPSTLDDLLRFTLGRLGEVTQEGRFLKILISQALVDPAFRERIQHGILPKRNAEIAGRLKRARSLGYLPPTVDTKALAEGFMTYLVGLVVVNMLIIGKPESKVRRETRAFFRELKKLAARR
jgi:AcrR family transcriptional regulator